MAHLKRLFAPRTWHIQRKENVFTTRMDPGSHGTMYGMPARTVLQSLIPLAQTSTEVDRMLRHETIQVDGRRITRPHTPVGLMDIVHIPTLHQSFRIILNAKGTLAAQPLPEKEGGVKICKIVAKTTQSKNQFQLTLHDGRNLLVSSKEKYRVGDSLLYDINKKIVSEQIHLDKGQTVYIIGGKHIGNIGTLTDISGKSITYTQNGAEVTTLRSYAFAVPNTFTL